jgi:hypothetical protein
LNFFFFSLDGKETKDQANSMVIISYQGTFPTPNWRHHSANRRASGRSLRFVLCGEPGGAMFCLALIKDVKTPKQDRTRRLTSHYNLNFGVSEKPTGAFI